MRFEWIFSYPKSLILRVRMPKRSVRLWADAEVIKADPATMLAGSGTHRRFSRTELIVACIVAPFAKQKVAIGALKAISLSARRAVADKHAPIEAAIRGRAEFLADSLRPIPRRHRALTVTTFS